jgi:hypothetical protein
MPVPPNPKPMKRLKTVRVGERGLQEKDISRVGKKPVTIPETSPDGTKA